MVWATGGFNWESLNLVERFEWLESFVSITFPPV